MKGIMLIEPLFNAAIEGEKTQIRRIIKDIPQGQNLEHDQVTDTHFEFRNINAGYGHDIYGDPLVKWTVKPRYQVEERIYLKEPYCLNNQNEVIEYKFNLKSSDSLKNECNFWENKQSMPEKYARYFVDITGIRVERAQDICVDDIQNEGIVINLDVDGSKEIRERWIKLWDSINKPPYNWDSNPFNWVYEFKLVK